MTDVQINAGTVTFSETERTVTGMLLPYGEECSSNLGRFSFDAGVLTIPADVPGIVSFNIEHARENVIGRAVSAMETPSGVVATFKVADGPEGDAALADIKSGKRRHLSAEVSNVIIKAGKAIGGKLFAAALVEKPAFPSATLLAAAVDTEDPAPAETNVSALEPDDAGDIAIDATATPTTVTVTAGDDTTTFTPKPSEEDTVTAVPNTLNASKGKVEKIGLSLSEVNTLFAQRSDKAISDAEFVDKLKGQNGATMFGALSDIKYDSTGGVGAAMGQPQWIGEVWSSLNYRQQVLPLFNHADLRAKTFTGFRVTTKPAGGDWTGNKGNVPSNTMVVAPVTGTAVGYAVGHDIAREFVDFPVEGFFEGYAAAVSEDYARWADGKVAAAAIAGATTLAGDPLANLPGGTANIGSAASAIIDGAVALSLTGTLPSFALVAPALWKQLLKTPANNVMGYLTAALGLEEGDLSGFTIRPSASIATGKVLVGAKEAVTVYELPGAPIRIDALDLARGGVDKAAFGWLGVNVNDALGLQLVTAATA